MRNGKYIVARLWPKYGGDVPSRTPVILGINPQKYETIFVYHTKNSNNPNIFEQKGKKVFYISPNSRPKFSFVTIWKLAKLFKAEKVDIVHCHKHRSAVYGILAAKLAKVPVAIAHVHGMGRSRNFKRRLQNRLVFRWASKILTVGRAVRDDVIRNNPSVDPDKVVSIGNSIDYEKFAEIFKNDSAKEKFGIEKDFFVFATAGRLAETKGQIYLIQAFAKVKKQIPNAYLLLAGDGPLKEILQQEAANLNCEENIVFLGRVDDMCSFYSAIDVFVLPSLAEGLPRSLIEAMAAGVLCIGTDAGGIGEILDDGRVGRVVPTQNEDALTEAMIEAAEMDENKKIELVTSAKNYIHDNFSHSIIINRLEKIYNTEAEKILNNL